MTISKELLDELLSGVERPEDLLGDKDSERNSFTSGNVAWRAVSPDKRRLPASRNLVLSRFSSGLFRAMFAMNEIWHGKEIHRRVSA